MPARSAAAIWILLAILTLARALAAFLPLPYVWGLGPLRFLSPWAGWVPWLLAALSLVPALARRVSLEALGDRLARGRAAPWVAGLLASSLVWALPDRTWFVGDFLMRQGNVEAGFAAGN